MFVPIVSFLINLIITLLLFLVSIGNLWSGRFFTAFYLLKVTYTTGDGPKSGWLSTSYNMLTFGLWNFCEGKDNVINACIEPKTGFTLEGIPNIFDTDEHYVPNAVRSFNKASFLFIPATCVAFLALVLSAIALSPRFRKRWLHAMSGFFMFLVTLCCVLLMIVVFTVNVSRKIQYERHLTPEAKTSLGPGVWITLALAPLAIFGSVFSAFAVCCPGRFEKHPNVTVTPHTAATQQNDVPVSKAEIQDA
ncbi:hypothetical protein BX616_001040 [Lobosporangium transversale]|uniref:SUR7/PalI family-domain-containing protein n=1 Tax=Lobosporangium transversale TaxID=64571 RepID=A0A1Y2GXP0_9FUNG|nr:SUR7/PalI family-domain-containing protein [Lobosporangium transversale]KAF9905311.1 hypothetical protein BX616_001040 [Lobosporangium transversale]ORZ27059.1 SUR7/PalI family-domain-containing protein [Lobosporangium transversale]|eukprot:XP_021884806.1 SUR7/PalI family-domain-containing protein [Lobosporangium transversale]